MLDMLPKYQRIPDVEEALCDEKAPVPQDDSDSESGKMDRGAVYPAASGGNPIQLCFRPRYPCSGENEVAHTVLGKTMDETVAVARAAFPALRAFPPERVEFMLLQSSSNEWERVLPNAWSAVMGRHPDRLGVRIADAPGDAEERKRLEDKQEQAAFEDRAVPAVAIAFGFIVFVLLIIRDSSK